MIRTFTKTAKICQSAKYYTKYHLTLARSFSAKIDPDVETQIMEVTKNFLENIKNAQITKLDKNSTFEELGLDSLDAIDLIVELEESFGIDLDNNDAENKIKTISDAAEVFTTYKAKNASPKE